MGAEDCGTIIWVDQFDFSYAVWTLRLAASPHFCARPPTAFSGQNLPDLKADDGAVAAQFVCCVLGATVVVFTFCTVVLCVSLLHGHCCQRA